MGDSLTVPVYEVDLFHDFQINVFLFTVLKLAIPVLCQLYMHTFDFSSDPIDYIGFLS